MSYIYVTYITETHRTNSAQITIKIPKNEATLIRYNLGRHRGASVLYVSIISARRL